MSSSQAQDQRNASIQENIAELVESLTGFKQQDENFKLCEQFAHSVIQNHRYLSVNSHEIKRKVEALVENMQLSNCQSYAAELLEMFNALVTAPDCLEHYEKDIHWSILSFLLTTAYNPVGVLRKKALAGESPYVEIAPTLTEEAVKEDNNEIISLLKEDYIQIEHLVDSAESDLSDWSDDDENDDENSQKDAEDNVQEAKLIEEKEIVLYNQIEPPQKEQNFSLFDSSESEKWLQENLQKRWWLNSSSRCDVDSVHESATFCEFWNQTVSKVTYTFKPREEISTVSEYCLIREILWMFSKPTNCKFFRIEDEQIKLNGGVSLSSVTEDGLRMFLVNFTEHFTIVYKLRNFCQHVSAAFRTIPAPHTYECYVAGVEDCLDNLQQFIIEKEKEIAAQEEDKIITVISLYHDLSSHFKMLQNLWDIHKSSVLDWNKYPAHICSSHLISGLFSKVRFGGCRQKCNLAFALLLTTLKVFINIVESWWTEGRLDDWRDEFLVEKTFNDDHSAITGYAARLFSKCKNRSFYINSSISQVIEQDSIIKLLLRHSLEAGYTLNILHNLDRIGEMKMNNLCDGDSLYRIFMNQILEELEKFRTNEAESVEEGMEIFHDENISQNSIIENLKSKIAETDEDLFLLMAFENSLKLAAKTFEPPTENNEKLYKLYQRFNSQTDFLMLPLENVLYRTISSLLEAKIAAANRFVMKIFKEEFHVLRHLQNIRKVLLLESSDLMQFFYSNLFSQVEKGETWANPYLLTIQLNDIMCSRFSDMTSLFGIEIRSDFKCETTRVLDAIDEISVSYNGGNNLYNMINDKSLESYNCVFKFLLKVKWGLSTLEKLKFPESYKKRPPYAELQMIDLILRRLAMLRFWMIYSVQCIHTHLMTHVLQSLGTQLDEKLEKAANLTEMISVHDFYIKTIYDHCFQMEDSKLIRDGVVSLLNLVYILRDEWNNACMITKMDENGDIEENSILDDYISTANTQVDVVEKTYCRCHQNLAEILNKEVFTKNKAHLAGLSAVFNYNVPA